MQTFGMCAFYQFSLIFTTTLQSMVDDLHFLN